MVFLRINGGESLWSDESAIGEIVGDICRRFPCQGELLASTQNYALFINGKKVEEEDEEEISRDCSLELVCGLVGGKGGFGSMLRALGAQIEKTTNKDACRDLSGRRLRDIKEEDKLKEWVAKKADREREEAEKKQKKLEKLRRIAKGENKHEFHDPQYEKTREEIVDRVHDAMEAAVKARNEKKEAEEEPVAGPSGMKRKIVEEKSAAGPSGIAPKRGLWMGVDLTDSDLDSSSDED